MTNAILVLALLLAQDQRPRVVNVHHHWGNPNEDAVRAQIEVMDAHGVAVAVNLDAGRSDGTLPGWIELEKKFPGRFVNFAKFTAKDFERIREPGFFEELVRELERAAKMGIRGIKVWNLLDPSGFEPGWAKLAGAKLPADVLEKFYHANAERLIPGLK